MKDTASIRPVWVILQDPASKEIVKIKKTTKSLEAAKDIYSSVVEGLLSKSEAPGSLSGSTQTCMPAHAHINTHRYMHAHMHLNTCIHKHTDTCAHT